MEKNSLGFLIYNNLKTIYKDVNIGLTSSNIESILTKGNLNKKNVKKEDLLKIIKILRFHIDSGIKSKEEEEQHTINKLYKNVESENEFQPNFKLDYIDNFTKLKEQDKLFKSKTVDIPKPNNRLENEKEILTKNYNITIESKDINKEKYPNSYSFQISFNNDMEITEEDVKINLNLMRISEFKLTEVILKNSEKLNFEKPYIFLELEEIGNLNNGTNYHINNYFIKLNLDEKYKDNKFIFFNFNNIESTKKFNPTITLNKLTIKLRDYDGNEIISNDSDEIISNLSLSFNIKVLTKNFTSNLI